MDSNFKQRYMTEWMKILYGDFPKYFETTIHDIIQQNTLLQEGFPTDSDIMYVKGIAYFSKIAAIGSNPNRYELHSDLKERVQNLFNDKAEMADETVIIQGYLRRILNLSTVEEDICMLLPDNIKSHLIQKHFHLNPNVFSTITKEKQLEFQKRNKQFSDLITERMLTNLLLTG